MTEATLAGRAIDVDLGPFVPRLTFLADSRMRLQAQIGPNTVDEVVIKIAGKTHWLWRAVS